MHPPKHNRDSVLQQKHNYNLKNEIAFNLISSPIANSLELGGTLSENDCSPSVLGSNNVLTMGKCASGFNRIFAGKDPGTIT